MSTVQGFNWGEVITVHSVGRYEIVEYHPRLSDPVDKGTYISEELVKFHPFVAGEDTHHGFNSLDRALAHCIAYKHDGINTKADHYFMRSIGA